MPNQRAEVTTLKTGTTTLPAELKRLQLRSRKLVTGDLLGQYRSAFRGSGLVFSDLRQYQPGDDIKHIHWKATARTGTVFVKSYEEERQLRVLLAVDTSPSMRATLGQQAYSKALEFCSLIGSLTQSGNDLLGLFLFADKPGEFIEPSARPKRFSRILSALLNTQTEGSSATDLNGALDQLALTLRKPSIVFILSDFECADFRSGLKKIVMRHDVVLVQMQPDLASLPTVGLVTFRDAESGELCLVDTGSKAVQRAWGDALKAQRDSVSEAARSCGADHIVITDNAARPLIELMRERVHRISR
jgi:uncharacterized protein (DUF58 family)